MADMNITSSRPNLTPEQFEAELWAEYVRENQFAAFMRGGDNGMNGLIHVNEDLSRKPGDTITFATVRKLVGAGVTGNQILEGNEELLDMRSMSLKIGVIRHAVAASEWDRQKSFHDILKAARPALKNWSMEKMRTDITTAFTSMNGVPFASATATQRNEWLADNADRVLFGINRSNNAGNVMATSLANIDAAADSMSGALLSKAKRLARTTHPAIRPVQVNKNGEWFVAFMPSAHFRDFKSDPAVQEAYKLAMERGKDNPLFTDGDLIWDGIIVKEIPEMPVIAAAGAAGIDVAATALCGAQAIGVGWAQKLEVREQTKDYQFSRGVAVQEMRGIGKLRFGKNPSDDQSDLVDAGVFSVFASATADS